MSEARASCGSCRSPGLPEFARGDGVGERIAAAAELDDGDVVVVSQKIVSKAEGRVRSSPRSSPAREARELAAALGKEPALVELILEESREVLRAERGVLIVETHHGFVCANAGIDTSNLPEPDTVCLLPEDPDASARAHPRRDRRATSRSRRHPARRRSPTASAAPGASARPRSRSAAPASPRWTTGAGAATRAGASWRRP